MLDHEHLILTRHEGHSLGCCFHLTQNGEAIDVDDSVLHRYFDVTDNHCDPDGDINSALKQFTAVQ